MPQSVAPVGLARCLSHRTFYTKLLFCNTSILAVAEKSDLAADERG